MTGLLYRGALNKRLLREENQDSWGGLLCSPQRWYRRSRIAWPRLEPVASLCTHRCAYVRGFQCCSTCTRALLHGATAALQLLPLLCTNPCTLRRGAVCAPLHPDAVTVHPAPACTHPSALALGAPSAGFNRAPECPTVLGSAAMTREIGRAKNRLKSAFSSHSPRQPSPGLQRQVAHRFKQHRSPRR